MKAREGCCLTYAGEGGTRDAPGLPLFSSAGNICITTVPPNGTVVRKRGCGVSGMGVEHWPAGAVCLRGVCVCSEGATNSSEEWRAAEAV